MSHTASSTQPSSDIAGRPDIQTSLFLAAAALATLLATLIRLFGATPEGRLTGLDYFGLWYDEAFSCLLALKPWKDMIWIAQQDVHPPLFYVALNLWFQLVPGHWIGASWARLLPALLGAACIPAVVALGAIVFSRRVGLLAGLLLALAPYHVQFSHEVRMYSLGCLMLTLEMVFLWRVAQKPNWVDGFLFCLFAALSIYSHYYIVLILFGHFAFFAAMRIRAGARFWVWTRETLLLGLGLIILYLPWFETYFVHYFNNTVGVHAFEASASLADVFNDLFQWPLGSHPWFPFESSAQPANQTFKTVGIGLVLYGLMMGAYVALWRRRDLRDAAWYTTGVLVAPVFLTALYLLGHGRFFARCTVFFFPIVFCLIAYAILAMPRRIFQIAITAALVAVFYSSTHYYLQDGVFRDVHHLVRQYLAREPAYPILCSRPFDFLPTAFYDYPRRRTYLLNSKELSAIQIYLMGKDQVIYRRDQIPNDDKVILIVSDWDFTPEQKTRAANRDRKIAEFERRWLDGKYEREENVLLFPNSRKWVYCGVYARK